MSGRRSRPGPRSTTTFAGAALLALGGWACSPSQSASGDERSETTAAAQAADTGDHARDSVIVRFRNTPTVSSLRSALALVKGTIEDKNNDGIHDRFAHIARGQLAVVRLDKTADVDAAIAQLRKAPEILYAEHNYIVHAVATPNDPRFAELYGLDNTGQTGGTPDADIDAVEAWDASVGSSDIVVGVVDTGVDYDHEDLAANMWVNPGEIPGNGADDDENGVIDDVHGFNAFADNGDPLDNNDHGTHCSGTIGAVGGNGVGIAGVNWDVQIMALKFLSAGGSGTVDDAIAAIDYAIAQRSAGVNLRVLSNSWSGGAFSQGLLDAITAASDAGILFVAAAANDSSDNDIIPAYPASYEAPNILAVAATDDSDRLASFSNFGATSVDLGAPGVAVLSTTIGNTYRLFSGTSMATPHVAGVAALVLSSNDSLSVEELKELLMTSGDPIPSLEGLTVSGRRLNAAAALDQAGPPVPRFNMAVTPPSSVIAQEETASYAIDLTSVADFAGDVALSVTSEPEIEAGVTITPVVAAPGAGTLTIATTQETSTGIYSFTITGRSGDLVRSRTVSLRVRAFGTVDVPFPSADTPIEIPDEDPVGVSSRIRVQRSIHIEEVAVDVNITHTWIGDLLVTLTSPQGTTVMLHNRAGGSADDIHRRFALPTEFIGQEAPGDWVLTVTDLAAVDVGTLDDWTLHVVGVTGGATFGVTALPSSQSVSQGGSTSFDVSVEAFEGFTGNVALSLTSQPALVASASFAPATVPVPGSSRLEIVTDCATVPGDYALTITGTADDGTTQSGNVLLTVAPFGSTAASFPSTDTPIAIPDNNATGIVSTINVSDDISITDLAVEVHITHTFIGDLVVALVGPNGAAVTLHNRQGGPTDNINRTYTVPNFSGLSSSGTWQLRVSDRAGLDVGRLDSWTLHVNGIRRDVPPTADFDFSGEHLTFQFTDLSRAGGCSGMPLIAWEWNFGDGTGASEQNPTHTYAAPGDYMVTLTVTDANGRTGSTTQVVTATRPLPFLSVAGVSRDPTHFEFRVDLRWTDAEGDLVELYRNELLVDIPDNDGEHLDIFRRYETSYRWILCEQFSNFCSNEVTVDFEPNVEDDQATVTTKIDGQTIVETVIIRDEE